MYLLDTNIISELRKPRPHAGLLQWLHAADDAHLHLSAVTLGEIQAGIELTRMQDTHKAEETQARLEHGLMVLSPNMADFAALGFEAINPFVAR